MNAATVASLLITLGKKLAIAFEIDTYLEYFLDKKTLPPHPALRPEEVPALCGQRLGREGREKV